jgi:hypothetical protein
MSATSEYITTKFTKEGKLDGLNYTQAIEDAARFKLKRAINVTHALDGLVESFEIRLLPNPSAPINDSDILFVLRNKDSGNLIKEAVLLPRNDAVKLQADNLANYDYWYKAREDTLMASLNGFWARAPSLHYHMGEFSLS